MPEAPRGDLFVDERGLPLLFMRLPAIISSETMRGMIGAIERAYDRGERFAVILDTSAVVKFPDAKARQILTDWVADPARAERERSFTVATAVVIPSSPLRALTAAINLVRRPVSPQQWTATAAEAADWARRRLAEARVAMPAAAESVYAEITAPRLLRKP